MRVHAGGIPAGPGRKDRTMKAIARISCAVAGVVWLAGCATPVGPNQMGGTVIGGATGAVIGGLATDSAGGAVVGGVIGALAGALVGKDIDDSLRQRVVQGQPLAIGDIKALSRAGIGDDLIVNQITATRTVYQLSTAQIIDLRDAGVSPKVIDFMIGTPRLYAQPPPARAYYYVEPYPYYYAPPPAVHFYYGPRYHNGPWHHW
jgi:surface antigen